MAVIAATGGVRAARGETRLEAGDQLLILAQGAIDSTAVLEALGIDRSTPDQKAEAD
jgi:hypothetical protein